MATLPRQTKLQAPTKGCRRVAKTCQFQFLSAALIKLLIKTAKEPVTVIGRVETNASRKATSQRTAAIWLASGSR